MWRYWSQVKYILFNDHVFRINFSSWTGLCYIRKSNSFGGVLKEEKNPDEAYHLRNALSNYPQAGSQSYLVVQGLPLLMRVALCSGAASSF